MRAPVLAAVLFALAGASLSGCLIFGDPYSDPCATSRTCGDCTPRAGCGWCASTSRCLSGNSRGPTGGLCSAGWSWLPSDCSAAPPPDAGSSDASAPPRDAATQDSPARDVVAPPDTAAADTAHRRAGGAAYLYNASSGDLRDLCRNDCSFLSDSDLRHLCAGDCSFISDSDLRDFCSGSCSFISNSDLRNLCSGSCSSISDSDLRDLCAGDCSFVSNSSLRSYCSGSCGSI